MKNDIEPKAMALRGAHKGALKSVIKCAEPSKNITILDVGVGQGALSKLMNEPGYSVKACEFNKDK